MRMERSPNSSEWLLFEGKNGDGTMESRGRASPWL